MRTLPDSPAAPWWKSAAAVRVGTPGSGLETARWPGADPRRLRLLNASLQLLLDEIGLSYCP